VSYEGELRDHLSRLRVECERRVQRATALLESKDPELKGAPCVSVLVDVAEAHAMDAACAQAEAAFSVPGRVVSDPAAEQRLRTLIDERALVQARHAMQGFAEFTGKQSAEQDIPRQQELTQRGAAKLLEAETAGEEGRVDDAQRLTEEAEQIRRLAAMPPPKPPGAELVRLWSLIPPPLPFAFRISGFCQSAGRCPRARRCHGREPCGSVRLCDSESDSGKGPPPERPAMRSGPDLWLPARPATRAGARHRGDIADPFYFVLLCSTLFYFVLLCSHALPAGRPEAARVRRLQRAGEPVRQ